MLTNMIIYKCLTLYFHHDSPSSNARMIKHGGNCQRREPIEPYCKIISKSACFWSLRVFFCLLLVGSGRCCGVGCVLPVVSHFSTFTARYRSFQVVSCSLQVVSGRFLLVIGRFRLLQVVSGFFLLVVGCFRSFQVVPWFSKYLMLVSFSELLCKVVIGVLKTAVNTYLNIF